MPNITQPRLAFLGIDSDNQALEMTQPANSNACGAYAVLAAVAAFHRFPVQRAEIAFQLTDGDVVRNLQTAVDASQETFGTMAGNVYRVTGILDPHRDPQDDEAGEFTDADGYNSPAAMAAVAKQLSDLSVRVLVTRVGLATLGQLYPHEQDRCNDIVAAQNVRTDEVYSAPAQGRVHLVCVKHAGGLHWLARGSDGNYYDPGDGSIGNQWGDPDPYGNIDRYQFAGVWLELSLPA